LASQIFCTRIIFRVEKIYKLLIFRILMRRSCSDLSYLEYVEKLPIVKMVDEEELACYELRYEHFCDKVFKSLQSRCDSVQLQTEIFLGLVSALDKWDTNRDLDKLVRDCVLSKLVEYSDYHLISPPLLDARKIRGINLMKVSSGPQKMRKIRGTLVNNYADVDNDID